MVEADTWQGLAERFTIDQQFKSSVQEAFRFNFDQAMDEGPERLAEYLDHLAGIASFSVRGTVYIPRFMKAFGDYIMLPSETHPEILDKEEIDTNDKWPYINGQVAFNIRFSLVDSAGQTFVGAEQAVEDGQPRIIYPALLQRFNVLHLYGEDILRRRELNYDERVLRWLQSRRGS